METLTRPILEWHAAEETLPSEQETGDRGKVRVVDRQAFAFAIDALGHGSEAAAVAERALQYLADTNDFSRLEDIFENCHLQLKGTRGVAMCLATIDAKRNTLTWLSVGNIQAVHVQRDRHGMPHYQTLIMRAGVVGDRLPELRATQTTLNSGDMIVLATDGIEYDWHAEYRLNISPRELCANIMARHWHGKDDALVLVMRYNGSEGFES